MVETSLQRKRKDIAFPQDNEFVNPFANSSQGAPRQYKSLLEKFVTKDQKRNIIVEELEVSAQDPEFSSFVNEFMAHDPQNYLSKLLLEGATLPPKFDVNTLRGASTSINQTQGNKTTISSGSIPQVSTPMPLGGNKKDAKTIHTSLFGTQGNTQGNTQGMTLGMTFGTTQPMTFTIGASYSSPFDINKRPKVTINTTNTIPNIGASQHTIMSQSGHIPQGHIQSLIL